MISMLGVILIIIIVFFLNSEREKHDMYDDLLDGYWEAPMTFCAKSGLKSAQIYFRESTAYLLVEDEDKVLLNKCIGFDKSRRYVDNVRTTDAVEYDITFDESVDPLPKQSRMRVSLKSGLLGLFVDNTLFLEMFKNNKATSGII